MWNNRHLYINGEELYLDEDEPIPINKQANDIGELKDRQADFTADFKIPQTRENIKILERAQLVDGSTYLPYLKNSATYIEDGVEMISGGYLVISGSSGGYFKAVIYSGNADFFSLINKLKLNNLSLPDLDYLYDITALDPVNEATRPDLKYLLFEPLDKGGDLKDHILFSHLRPFIKVQRLVSEIVTQQGWTVDGDLSFIDEWVLCPKLAPTLSEYTASMVLRQQRTIDVSIIPKQPWFAINTGRKSLLWEGTDACYFKPQRKGKYLITVSGRVQFSGADSIEFKIRNTVMASNANANIAQDFNIQYEQTIEQSDLGDLFDFKVSFVNPTSNALMTFYSLRYDFALTESVLAQNDTITASSILPDIEQSKFLKSVANQYGLSFECDSARRKLRIWRFDDLKANVTQARDWSSYIEEGSEEVAYRFGSYAKANVMKYKEVEDTPKGYGDGTLFIADDALDATKDQFTLDFAPSQDIIALSSTVAKIPLYTINSSNEYEDKENNDVRVVKYYDKAGSLIVNSFSKSIMLTLTNLHIAYFINVELNTGLGFDYSLIRDHYSTLSQMLDRCKVLTVNMRLPRVEVQNLKHSIPVYIKKYGSYFYVNKITGWRKDKKCKVELVKL